MKRFLFLVFIATLLAACAPALTPPPVPSTATNFPQPIFTPAAVTETPTPEIVPTGTPAPSATPTYPPEGYGPKNFPSDVDPLTGLQVANPALLERRPLIVKVENLPRSHRPQWGLSFADHVFEYYTEEGSTRFAAIFYGRDAEMVGPIRSARLFDIHLIRMYKAIFAFGSADPRVFEKLVNSEFEKRLVVEAFCPPMCRFEPKGINILYTKTADLGPYVVQKKVENTRQNLDGLTFNMTPPGGGTPAPKVFVRYSGAIYNRWDYDPVANKYLRFSDKENDLSGTNEVYDPLTDRFTGQPISADNVVVLYVTHQFFSRVPEIIDIVASGPGKAYIFRDGQMYPMTWNRLALDNIITLWTADGKPFPLKPGNTWFEIVGSSTTLQQQGADWRFTFKMP
jgi:hypothetical protein